MATHPVSRWQVPDEYWYSSQHQWCRIDGESVVTGVTDYTQEQAGEMLYVGLPAVGDWVQAGQPMGTLESGKWVGQIYAPVDGMVTAVNDRLLEDPGLLNRDPYGQGWVARLKPKGNVAENLLAADQYRAFLDRIAEDL